MFFNFAVLFSVVIILTVSCFGFAKTVCNENLGIIGGNSSEIKRHPYQVAVLFNSSFSCSGAVLNKRWVLTVASCVNGNKRKHLKIHSKSNEAEEGGKKYAVKKIIVHHQFKPDTYDYDFALLKIRKHFKFHKKLKAIKIAKKSLSAGTEAIISGWGGTVEAEGTIQEANVTTIERDDCQTIFTNYPVTSSMICAQNPNAGPCWDDFGDPLVYKKKLYGLFSWGKDCSELKYPSVYSNVPYVKKWILSTIKKKKKNTL